MGVNIHILRTVDGQEDLDFEAHWWDSLRYAGDSDLFDDEILEWEFAEIEDHWTVVKRPKNWTEFRRWVDINVVERNRQRWYDCIEVLKDRPDLWLEFSS